MPFGRLERHSMTSAANWARSMGTEGSSTRTPRCGCCKPNRDRRPSRRRRSAPPDPDCAGTVPARCAGYVVAGVMGASLRSGCSTGHQSMTRDSGSPGDAGIGLSVSAFRRRQRQANHLGPRGFDAVCAFCSGFETDRRSRSGLAAATPSSKSLTRVMDSGGPAQIMRKVRAALSGWLLLSRRGHAHAPVSKTAVIRSAEGRTPLRHVPIRSGGGIVIHEQRWRRSHRAGLLDDRQARATR